jgi:hypothetical protein
VRFAGAIAADEARALARPDREFRVLQKRRAAEGERDTVQMEKRRGDGGILRSALVKRKLVGASTTSF